MTAPSDDSHRVITRPGPIVDSTHSFIMTDGIRRRERGPIHLATASGPAKMLAAPQPYHAAPAMLPPDTSTSRMYGDRRLYRR